MSNRIDLTQFEGLDIDREMMHFQSIIEEIPDLLAELKRCYEEIDVLRGGLDMAHRCLSAHNFRQCNTCGDHYHDDYGPLCGHTASE